MTAHKGGKRIYIYNALFLIICAAIFLFLWNAPPETTAKMPYDGIHSRFYPMAKKDAEKQCETCHNPDGEAPLPANHPPKYRCLFCHKKVEPENR